MTAKRGDNVTIQLQNHAYGSWDLPTKTVIRTNKSSETRVDWRGMSVGFLPAGWRQDSQINESGAATMLIMNEAFFRDAENENMKYQPDRLHAMNGTQSPVGYTLMESLRQLARIAGIGEWPLLTESLAVSIAGHLIQYFSGGSRASPLPPALPRDRIRRVMDFVEENLHRIIHLSELANVAALSQFHFARSFKQVMGLTPVRYVWGRRVERARVLLRNINTPLAVVAMDCGFSSQSHFTTVFKRETGLTPAQYRARL